MKQDKIRKHNNEYYIMRKYKNEEISYFIKLLNITLFL